MPANLTPDYLEAERNYRHSKGEDEKLYWLERMLSTLPKHKGTEKIQADIKKRISAFKKEMESRSKGKGGHSTQIEKQGDIQVVILGTVNTGKSTFLSLYTTNTSEVADYEFTTEELVPGMGYWGNVKFQMIDTPAIKEGFTPFYVINQVQMTDVVLIVLSCDSDIHNDYADIRDYFSKRHIFFIDGSEKFRNDDGLFIPEIIVMNKIDLSDHEKKAEHLKDKRTMPVSLMLGEGREMIYSEIFEHSGKIRVYTKEAGEKPDMENPFVVKNGTTVLELAGMIHKDFIENFNYAKIWGEGYYDSQRIGKEDILKDSVIIEFNLK